MSLFLGGGAARERYCSESESSSSESESVDSEPKTVDVSDSGLSSLLWLDFDVFVDFSGCLEEEEEEEDFSLEGVSFVK